MKQRQQNKEGKKRKAEGEELEELGTENREEENRQTLCASLEGIGATFLPSPLPTLDLLLLSDEGLKSTLSLRSVTPFDISPSIWEATEKLGYKIFECLMHCLRDVVFLDKT